MAAALSLVRNIPLEESLAALATQGPLDASPALWREVVAAINEGDAPL